MVTDDEFVKGETMSICGSTEEDESCLKVHLVMTHKSNNPEQLLRTLQNSGSDAPKLGAIPKTTVSDMKITKEKKSGVTCLTKGRIAHEGAEGSMIKLGKGNGKGWTSAKLAEKIQETGKKKRASQGSKDPKNDRSKPKTCTDSPPSKKGRRSFPVVAMTRVRSNYGETLSICLPYTYKCRSGRCSKRDFSRQDP